MSKPHTCGAHDKRAHSATFTANDEAKPGKNLVPEWQVVDFKLIPDTPFVYANDRHQVMVRVFIEAETPGGKPVELKREDVASLTFLDYYHPERLIPFTDFHRSGSYKGWSAQEQHRGYDAYPVGGKPTLHGERLPTSGPDAPGQYFDFWLSAMPEAAAFGLTLAVAVTAPDGATYRSDGTKLVDGIAYDYDELDVSGCVVTAVEPVSFASGAFKVSVQSPPNLGIWHQPVELWLAPDGVKRGVVSASSVPYTMVRWHAAQTDDGWFTGFAGPGDTAFHWGEVPVSDDKLPPLDAQPVQACTIMVCKRNDMPRPPYPEPDPPKGPMDVTCVDRYGTDQHCKVAFDQDTGKIIVL